MSMVWPTLGSRTAKEQEQDEVQTIAALLRAKGRIAVANDRIALRISIARRI